MTRLGWNPNNSFTQVLAEAATELTAAPAGSTPTAPSNELRSALHTLG